MSKMLFRIQSTILPRRVYANFHIPIQDNFAFRNENYINLLRFIGKHCFKTEDIRSVCRCIKEEYNRTYHFNRMRNFRKRMSINQIEALAYSFDSLFVKGDVVVRIPFATVPILFFILIKYKEIMDCSSDIAKEIDNTSIGAHLCAHQIDIMRVYLNTMLNGVVADEEYVKKCRALNDVLVMAPDFVSMNWQEFCADRTDYVRAHWNMG